MTTLGCNRKYARCPFRSLYHMMDSLTIPHELTDLEREAIGLHFQGLRAAWEPSKGGHALRTLEFNLPGRPPLFVKQDSDCFELEASTQHFFYTLSQGDESSPRISKLFDAFRWPPECGPGFMVMEKIDAPTLKESGISEDEAVQHAARAVKWLLEQLPHVPETCFGRISFDRVRATHPFFKDHEARQVFANADDLAEYIAECSKMFPGGRRRPFSPLLGDILTSVREGGRYIYHGDIREDNFLLLAEGDSKKVCMIDFQRIGILTQVFQTMGFFHCGPLFAARVARELGYEPLEEDFVTAFRRIRGIITMMSGAVRS